MSTQEILAELPSLSTEKRAQVAKALQDLAVMEQKQPPKNKIIPRAGLHEGAWEVADDFDAPLPDEFWFGKEA